MNRRSLNNAILKARVMAREAIVRYEKMMARMENYGKTSEQNNQYVGASGVQPAQRDDLSSNSIGGGAGELRSQ